MKEKRIFDKILFSAVLLTSSVIFIHYILIPSMFVPNRHTIYEATITKLHGLGQYLSWYMSNNDGALPISIDDMISSGGIDPKLAISPISDNRYKYIGNVVVNPTERTIIFYDEVYVIETELVNGNPSNGSQGCYALFMDLSVDWIAEDELKIMVNKK